TSLLVSILEQNVQYDGDGNVLQSTDGDGNLTVNSWDADGNLLSSKLTDPSGQVIRWVTNSYDLAGNLVTNIQGNPSNYITKTTNSYDGSQLTSSVVTDKSNHVLRILEQNVKYDRDGNVFQSTDGDGNLTQNSWDAAGNLLTSTTKDGGGNVIRSASNT